MASHVSVMARSYAWVIMKTVDLIYFNAGGGHRAAAQALKQVMLGYPWQVRLVNLVDMIAFVTVLTDMADHPPSFWMEPDQPQHLICGTAYAAKQALSMGCPPERIHRTSGMIMRPSFYEPSTLDRLAERRALGLNPDQPVGLVLFGGLGSAVMKRIAAKLPQTPLILMCGQNAALAKSLRAAKANAPRIVVEFTPDVAYWMHLADFFIGKPGPASLSEAVHMGLPVIVTRNTWTMPQERWNTEWVIANGLGVVHHNFCHVREGVDAIVGELPRCKRNVSRMQNQAVFEVPEILARLLDAASPAEPPLAGANPARLRSDPEKCVQHL